MYNEVELWLFPDTDISELRAVPGPKAPGLGEFECTSTSSQKMAQSVAENNFERRYIWAV